MGRAVRREEKSLLTLVCVCVCGKEREHKLSSGGTGKTRISAIRRIPSLSIVRFCGKEFRPSREMMRRVREREREKETGLCPHRR